MPLGIEFGLLGPLRVCRGEAEITVTAGKQRAVLAALLLNTGRVVSAEELTSVLWDVVPPPSAAVSLHNYVRRLRQALGDDGHQRISTRPRGYMICTGPGELDLEVFESLLATAREQARAGAWEAVSDRLAQALALWRGEPLADVGSEELALREVPRLTEMRLQAIEDRIDAEVHLGRQAQVIAELQGLAAAHPLRERLHGLLMLALYRDGRQGEALLSYQHARHIMIEELGTEPGTALHNLHQQILIGDPALGPPGPAVTVCAAPGTATPLPMDVRFSLPPDGAAFTGRAAELDRISATVLEHAHAGGVVAIHAIGGMPGAGKTALAVHAAHLLRKDFPARCLFIDLHAHTPGRHPVPPEAALAGLLAAAGVEARNLPSDLEGRAALWRDTMAGQRALLVLDDAASSAQVTPLLPAGDGCLVLVTSRHHLGDLPGAEPLLLETLPPPEAHAMFARLAPRAAAGPRETVAELMGLAGYLPLAISLLARLFARHPSWTLADLVAETRQSLLRLAAEDDTVAAAFDLSYQHLDTAQQRCFTLLGLCPGTTTDPYAAAALTGITLPEATRMLDALQGEGLLTETGYRRYGMHDLLRRYARDHATALPPRTSERAVRLLLDYYQHIAAHVQDLLARQTHPGLPAATPPPRAAPVLEDAGRALAWARAERGNLLACLDHSTRTGQHARVIALTAALAELLRRDGPWAEAVTRHATALHSARHLGDQRGQADALNSLGAVRWRMGDYLGAAKGLEQALAIYCDLGYRPGQANVILYLGAIRRDTGDYLGAAGTLEQALAIYRDHGDRGGEVTALNETGTLHRLRGEPLEAQAHHQQALDLARAIDSAWDEGHALAGLGRCAAAAGHTPRAKTLLRQAHVIFQRTGTAEAPGILAELNALTSPESTR